MKNTVVPIIFWALSMQPLAAQQPDASSSQSAREMYQDAVAMKPSTAAERMEQMKLLEQSTAIDPDFVPAIDALGYAYLRHAGTVGGRGPYYELASETLRRAYRADPNRPLTLQHLASLEAKTGRPEESAALLQRGLKTNPDDPAFSTGLGYVYRYAGLMDESIEAYREAQRLDGSPQKLVGTVSQIMKSLIYRSELAGALECHEEVLNALRALGRLPDSKTLFYEGVIYFYAKNWERAFASFDAASALDPGDVWSVFGQAYRAAAAGERQRLSEIIQQLESRDIVDGERRYRLVHFHALGGNVEGALRNLATAIEGGFFNFPYFSKDPLIDGIRGADGFDELLERARVRHFAFKERFGKRGDQP
jgi:tetratricopeptide (TPR) repeat protein